MSQITTVSVKAKVPDVGVLCFDLTVQMVFKSAYKFLCKQKL